MGVPVVTLEEQRSDPRARQVAYRLAVRTTELDRIRIKAIEPRIPQGGRLVEIVDTSLAEIDARRKDLIAELNASLTSIFWISSEGFRRSWVERQQEAIKEAFNFSYTLRVLSETMFPSQNSIRNWVKTQFESIKFTIYSATDARTAFDRWVKGTPGISPIDQVFEAKLEQLEGIEATLGTTEEVGLAEVDASSPLTSTYVIDFKRGFLETQRYQVSFEVEYSPVNLDEPGRTKTRVLTASSTAEVSPSPLALSVVAVVSALLGGAVKILLASNTGIEEVAAQLNSSQLVVASIVALIFFNAYEQTTLGRRIRMAVNWRAALLIGALCGLAHERIVAALKALIGA